MQYDPVRVAYQWVQAYLDEFGAFVPVRNFSAQAATAADAHVREGASQVEWFLFTTTFFEAAMRLYQEQRVTIPSETDIVDNWLAEADEQGRAWYCRRRKINNDLRQPPLLRAECADAARMVADTRLATAWIPLEATEADKARFVEAFVQGALEAWRSAW